MARGSGRTANEYDGTEKPSGNGDAIAGASAPLDPDAAAGTAGTGGGNSGGSGERFDPAIHAGPDKRNADGSYTRKRGRKSGSGSNRNNAPKKAVDLGASIEALTKTLVILHTGIAGVTGTPELVIDEEEGKMLANAAANVMAQFDLQPDPKTQAIIGLVMAAGTVYGPRAYMISARKAQARKAKETGQAEVFNGSGAPMGTTEFSVETPVN